MKKLLIITASLMCVAGAYAQGLVAFNLKSGTSTTTASGAVWAPIFLPEPADSFLIKHGNIAAVNISPGTQTYGGGFVTGPGFTAALFGGTPGTVDTALTLVGTTAFRTSTTTTLGGTVNPITTNVPGVLAGSSARLQLRVWDNKGGTVTSWAQVINPANDLLVLRGESLSFDSGPLGNGLAPNVAANLQGLTSFNLHLVPEPSAIALGVLGLGALVMFRRRK